MMMATFKRQAQNMQNLKYGIVSYLEALEVTQPLFADSLVSELTKRI